MKVDENGDMIKGSFKWLKLQLENLEQVEGHHEEKGQYTELFTPDGQRVMGTREYLDEYESDTDDLC